MSNTLAIATVTETLRYTIHKALPGSGVGGAHVTTLRLDAPTGLPNPGVNIFLYQVTPNLAWQNADLPTRRADGSLARRPQAALDLHYLLTFYGEDATLDQQRLLGATMLELHAAPVLSRDVVRRVQAHVPFLNESNLADQIDVVRVTPANLSLEDMNRLWMTFPNVDYILSVAYVAGVVLIETDDEPPGTALPVLRRRVLAVPSSLAAIDSVRPQPVDLSGSSPTAITLIGTNLDPSDAAAFTSPGVAGLLYGTVQPGTGGNQLVVALPDGLHAGVNSVQLIQYHTGPPTHSRPPRMIAQSNALAFIIRPAILEIRPVTASGLLEVDVSPTVGPDQRVSLLLNQSPAVGLGQPVSTPPGQGATPMAFTLPAATRTVESGTVTFDVSGLPSGSIPPEFADGMGGSIPAGAYLARIRVDGAESRLVVDSTGRYSGPTANIP